MINKAIAVHTGHKHSSHIVDIDMPQISSSEVLVRVLDVGICGTDAELDEGIYGEPPSGFSFLVIGHESFGVIEEVGLDVKEFKKGDYVVGLVRRPCPECINCSNNENDMCLTGEYAERGIKGLHGYMVNYYKEKPEFLVKIPAHHRNVGVLLEPLSIVEKAVEQTIEMQRRMYWEPKKALVLGAGPIGILATMILRASEMEVHTIATRDKESLKAQLVRACGASYINTKLHPISSLLEGVGRFDIIIDATGNSQVAFEALSLLHTNGVMCLTSVTCGDRKMEIEIDKLNLDLVLGNKIVYGVVNSNKGHFEAGIQHFDEFEKRWPDLLPKLITRRLPMESYKEALVREPEGIKTILEMGDG
jgi:threonine dehydrogenase-like Zn-dependent dehydrogenase